MKKNIIVSGVGGQGILSISFILANSAMDMGLNSKQSEVHGMSQRGGPVYSFLRISDSEIFSDLIPKGTADLIISLEPMEALRYVSYLKPEGLLLTDKNPVLINGYDIDRVLSTLGKIEKCKILDAKSIAREAGNILAQNMVMVGAASTYLELDTSLLKKSISLLFARKSQSIIDININAFEEGVKQTAHV